MYSIHRLTKVREVGEVEKKIVINELLSEIRRPLSNLSTIGGLRQMIIFPVSFLRNVPGMNHSGANETGQNKLTVAIVYPLEKEMMRTIESLIVLSGI